MPFAAVVIGTSRVIDQNLDKLVSLGFVLCSLLSMNLIKPFSPVTKPNSFPNSVDPHETADKVPSHQDQHC